MLCDLIFCHSYPSLIPIYVGCKGIFSMRQRGKKFLTCSECSSSIHPVSSIFAPCVGINYMFLLEIRVGTNWHRWTPDRMVIVTCSETNSHFFPFFHLSMRLKDKSVSKKIVKYKPIGAAPWRQCFICTYVMIYSMCLIIHMGLLSTLCMWESC